MTITGLVSQEANKILAISEVRNEALRFKMENCISSLKEISIYGRKNCEISTEIQSAVRETKQRLIDMLNRNKEGMESLIIGVLERSKETRSALISKIEECVEIMENRADMTEKYVNTLVTSILMDFRC
jgi:hypothetical protein